MADEKKEPWLNYLALTTIVLAVCATLSTFKGSSYSTRSVMSQTLAANQWAYFQAKSLKGYLYEIQKQEFEIEIATNPDRWPAATVARYRSLADRYGAEIARYDEEKRQIQAEAKLLEARRDHAQRHSQAFGIAVIFLQIGILLSSVAALLRRKPLWWFGMASGAAGMYHFAYGFLAP